MDNVIYFLTHFIMQNIQCLFVCLFVCLFALGLQKKSCLINLQTQDLSPTRPPAVAIGNTFSIVLLFFHAILITIPLYKSVFPTHLLEERKVHFYFFSPKEEKSSYFPIYSVFICLCHHLSCTSHACMIASLWPPVLKFDLKKENPKRLQSSDMLTTQQGPLFSCRSFINGACEVGCGDLDNSCPDTLNIVKSRFTVCLMEGAHFRGSCVSVNGRGSF